MWVRVRELKSLQNTLLPASTAKFKNTAETAVERIINSSSGRIKANVNCVIFLWFPPNKWRNKQLPINKKKIVKLKKSGKYMKTFSQLNESIFYSNWIEIRIQSCKDRPADRFVEIMFHSASNKSKPFQLNQYAVDHIIDVTTQKVSIVYAESIEKILFDRDRVASALL